MGNVVIQEEIINTIADKIADVVAEKLKTAEHDGCEGCAFSDAEEWEMPCCKCKQGCKDYWRANDGSNSKRNGYAEKL